MEDVKIMENMKEVLKKSKKSKHKKSRAEKDANGAEEDIAGLLSKNWNFSSPPANSKSSPEESESSKVNIFERMMSKKAEPLTQISPEVNGLKKKRKYVKKPKFIDNSLDDSTCDENKESKKRKNGIHNFLNGSLPEMPKTDEVEETKKRIRETEAIETHEDEPEIVVKRTPKRRKTKLEEKVLLDSNENSVEKPPSEAPETPTNYQSGRPRRSCAGKVNYEMLISPEKTSTPETKTGKKKKLQESPEFVEIVDESPKKAKKLAPVFVKKVPKPAEDPAVVEARRSFLLSGLPEDLKNSIDKQRQFEEEILGNELIAFPEVAHVRQGTGMRLEEVSWKSSKVQIIPEDDEELESLRSLTLGSLTSCQSKLPKQEKFSLKPLEPFHDLNTIVKQLKEDFDSFPTNRCIKQLRGKFLKAEGESSFTEIFKPQNFNEFLVNVRPVRELRKFLTTWNEKSEDFDSEDSSSRQSLKGLNNFVVLSGDHGTGKTSSVYAIAKSLNFQVIEVNAGSKRTGKKMLQEIQEATQSHRVKESSQESNQSIILIEDAELAFESDEGFVSSIQQLINISKRPVVLTTNNRNCQHLQKFILYNEISYDSSSKTHNICKYLSLLCLVANYQIAAVTVEHLYERNKRDLRRTINAIEFFIRSGVATTEENDANLMGLSRRSTETRREPNDKTLSSVHFESSIVSGFAARLRGKGEEISFHQRTLMDEMADFIDERCNAVEIRRDLTEGKQKIIERSPSSDLISQSPSLIATRTIAMDYSPMLRDICRSEKVRNANGRRTTANNRGHYLRFLITQSGNDYFNEQCEMFQQ